MFRTLQQGSQSSEVAIHTSPFKHQAALALGQPSVHAHFGDTDSTASWRPHHFHIELLLASVLCIRCPISGLIMLDHFLPEKLSEWLYV